MLSSTLQLIVAQETMAFSVSHIDEQIPLGLLFFWWCQGEKSPSPPCLFDKHVVAFAESPCSAERRFLVVAESIPIIIQMTIVKERLLV